MVGFLFFTLFFTGFGAGATACSPDELQEIERFVPVVKRDLLEGMDFSVGTLKDDLAECGKSIDEYISPKEIAELTKKGDLSSIQRSINDFKNAEVPRKDGLLSAKKLAEKYQLKGELTQIALLEDEAEKKRSQKTAKDQEAFISNCKSKTIDLTGKLKLGPPRDQDSIGWCYAFVAADLLTAHYGKQISAFDIALGYNSAEYKNSLNAQANCDFPSNSSRSASSGGYISTAILEGEKKGYCLEKDMPSFVNGASQNLGSIYLLTCELSRMKMVDEACQVHNTAKDYYPNISTQDWRKIFTETAGDPERTLTALRDRTCQNRVKDKPKMSSIFYPNINYNFEQQVQKSLNEGRIVGVSVKLDSILMGAKDAYHAMTVVGQEYNEETKSCDFVVRNSWGKSCGSFDLTKVKCTGGVLRVPSSTMAAITDSTTEVLK